MSFFSEVNSHRLIYRDFSFKVISILFFVDLLFSFSTIAADDSASTDCLPLGRSREIEELQSFGIDSISILEKVSPIDPKLKKEPLVKESKEQEVSGSKRKVADIDELIDLMSGAIEDRWESKLSQVNDRLVKSLRANSKLRGAKYSFNKEGGRSCQIDSDFYACGKLEVKSSDGEFICDLELLENSKEGRGEFKVPSEISFPSYALTCLELNKSGEVRSSKRIYFDPNLNIEEEVESLKKSMRDVN